MEKSQQKSEFAEWLLHPVTQRLQAEALARREEIKDLWARAGVSGLEHYETAVRNAKAIGQCETFLWLVELKVEDLYEELEHVSSPG